MNLWQLEVARLIRTRRLLGLIALFLFFGITEPLAVRYMGTLLKRTGGNITVIVPKAVPADAIRSYVNNGLVLGLVGVVLVAAAALALDARPGLAAFYRTRVRRPADLVVPRMGASAAAAIGAYTAGLLAAWYETAVLLGGVPVGRLFAGLGFEAAYLLFTVALVAAVSTLVRTVIGTVGVSVVILLVLPIAGSYRVVGDWLPSELVGSQDALLRGSDFSSYLRPTLVALTLSAVLTAIAIRRAAHREL